MIVGLVLLRKSSKTKHVPIIFMSAVYQDFSHISRGYDAGAIDFMVKPLDAHILRAKVKVFLELHMYRSLQIFEREQAFRLLFDNAIVGIATHEMIFNAQGEPIDYRFLSANPAFERHTGLKMNEILGRYASDAIPGIEKTSLIQTYGSVVLSGQPITVEQYYEPLGKFFILNAYRLDNKRFAVTLFDISERKLAEEHLREAASVFEHTNDGIMITDASGHILDVNRAFTEMTGYSRDEVLHQNPRFLRSEIHNSEFFSSMWQALHQQHHWQGEIWNKRKNEETFPERVTISAVCDENNQIYRYVALFSDITKVKEHQRQLERIAHYDALTNLPNRLLLADRLQQAMTQAARYNHFVAAVYLDLDGFKAVNDRYGHEAGDFLLIEISKRMRSNLRDSDTLSRLGGDEFVAVLPNLEHNNNCLPVLERLLSCTNEPILYRGHELKVSASIGVSFYPQTEDIDADQLLRQADQAMYQSKQTGKNRFHIFDAEQDRNARHHHASLEQIRQALAQEEFLLFYQPKVNMRTGQILGVEALIRWQHPERGLLTPFAFLPILDNHPLLIDMGDWVLKAALAQFSSWHQQGLHLPISINIDGIQLKPANFVSKLQQQLSQHPCVQAGDIELEVLESSALHDIGRVSQILADCKALGVVASIDDFGTGYSSLSYLKRLPVELLKIDQTFVRDMLNDPDDLSIIQGVLGLAQAFNRNVIAEGVETEQHGACLLKLGCVLGQGYAIARPIPADEIPQWVQTWRPPSSWQT